MQQWMKNARKPRTDFTRYGLLDRAADYFAQARKPRAEWKKLEDLTAQLVEFDLRCAAADYDTAASVLTEIHFDYLFLWGHYGLMIQMHEAVANRVTDANLRMGNLNGLGMAHQITGKVKKSIDFYQQGLNMAQESKDRTWEGVFLGNLGSAYADLGDARKAIEFYEQALVIDREIGDRRGEGTDLSNLASEYSSLAEYDKSVDFYNQALQNARDIGNKYGESKRLNGLAGVLFEKGDLQNALSHSREALRIGQEMSSPEVCIESHHSLATVLLLAENLDEALQAVQDAEKYNRENFIFNVSALHGIVALRQADTSAARQAFASAINQANKILAKTPEYYDALDAKGLALCGLMLTTGDSHLKDDCHLQAIETFRAARKIAPHAGSVKSVLRLFDELVKCDEEGVLTEIREVAEGTDQT